MGFVLTHIPISPKFSWQDQHVQDIADLRRRLADLRPGLATADYDRFSWLSVDGRQYIKCFTDGSCLFPTDPYLAVAGWALYFHPGSNLNRSAPLRTTVQNSYLAEVRAVAEALAGAQSPLAIYCDCQSVVDTLTISSPPGNPPVIMSLPLISGTSSILRWDLLCQLAG